jgi:hypothetical protein
MVRPQLPLQYLDEEKRLRIPFHHEYDLAAIAFQFCAVDPQLYIRECVIDEECTLLGRYFYDVGYK